MSELRVLEFSAIGSLDYDPKNNSHIVVPLLPSMGIIDSGNATEMTRGGPYKTVHAFLVDQISQQMAFAPSPNHKVSLSLLRLFAGALPDTTLDGPPFVLLFPDFGYQNVLVDNEGKVTSLIDWDGMMVGPRQGGYARYPSWITRDWDPLLYGYPETKDEAPSADIQTSTDAPPTPSREELLEDSPSTLQKFRGEYLAAFEEADPESARYTRNSHVYEALEIAISNPHCRGHKLEKLTNYVFGIEKDSGVHISSWLLEKGIRVGGWLDPNSSSSAVSSPR